MKKLLLFIRQWWGKLDLDEKKMLRRVGLFTPIYILPPLWVITHVNVLALSGFQLVLALLTVLFMMGISTLAVFAVIMVLLAVLVVVEGTDRLIKAWRAFNPEKAGK